MIPCFITASLDSERLPRKYLLPLGVTNVIDYIVRRCNHFSFKPILCVPEYDVKEFGEASPNTEIFGGDPQNVETRLIECAHHLNIKTFHNLDGDDPFFDEFAVLDSFQCAVQQRLWRVTPSYNSRSGTGRVGTSYNLDSPQGGDRNWLDQLTTYPWPQRLTLDYAEDYHLIVAVDRMCGGFMAPRTVIDDLFIRNPDLHKVNWFRNEAWKERQINERPGSGP